MENKRKYHRIPSELVPCTIDVDDVRISGLVADESISGAKIVGLDLLTMPFNKKLSLEYRNEKIEVHARNAIRAEDNSFMLGVVRTEMLDPERTNSDSNAMLINCYVKHGNACVICMPIHIESEKQIVIQLWDGVQFRVPRSSLAPMSRGERFAMLREPGCFEYTASMYGFDTSNTEENIQNLFEYEFGSYDDCPVAKLAVGAHAVL